MKSLTLTGTTVKALRAYFELPASAFGEVIGVTGSTVYRWEATGDAPIKVDPHTAKILQLMIDASKRERTIKRRVYDAFLKHGGLAALYQLLSWQFAKAA